jgi:hypothetical protein
MRHAAQLYSDLDQEEVVFPLGNERKFRIADMQKAKG